RTDPTNLTGKYARNRVRLEVIPILEELYPAAASNIARAASLVREDLEVLEELATGPVERKGQEVVLPLDGLMKLRPSLRRHAVRLAYTTLVPDTAPLPMNLIEAVLGLLEGGEGTRTLDLPGGVVASGRFGEELAFYRGPRSMVSGREEIRAGEAVVLGGWRISAREGDIIRPLGLGGTKKVLRAMMDRKVPSDLRRSTPVVVDGRDEVAWIVLGELDERYKVDERTEQILRLEVARIS
ncbi:MAG: tRNA lysidine(34) synthetase TilS, partial [Actinomycetota bacterium]|nr:tRNA lysidine(34) synthetase TilS [Actinomycetota bacterium]